MLLQKKSRDNILSRLFLKEWRLPTLAEPIELLPSATLCLTSEFGMGSGRATALRPPNICLDLIKNDIFKIA